MDRQTSDFFSSKGISKTQLKLNQKWLKIPYEDNFFDFVTINGVLIHLNNMDEIESFREGARVLKPGGYYYTVYGVSEEFLQMYFFLHFANIIMKCISEKF